HGACVEWWLKRTQHLAIGSVPQADDSQRVSTGEHHPIRRYGHGAESRAWDAEYANLSAGRDVPQTYRSIPGTGGNALAVGRKHCCAQRTGVPKKLAFEPSGFSIQEPGGIIGRAKGGENPRAVGREAGGGRPPGKSVKGANLLGIGAIPQ